MGNIEEVTEKRAFAGLYRDSVTPPAKYNGRSLTLEELTQWDIFNNEFAPYIVGDNAGNIRRDRLPAIEDVTWCSLYPLSIYYLVFNVIRASNARIQLKFDSLPWRNLFIEYCKQRTSQLLPFRHFLDDWNLGEHFGVTEHRTGFQSGHHWGADTKIFGMQAFAAKAEIDQYALRWQGNPVLNGTRLSKHRLTVSRVIDLICSELLDNGFEHGGPSRNKVFIMAKLCSRESAWRALQLNKTQPYLTRTEERLFRLSTEQQLPILQVCVGDNGFGFIGNNALKEAFGKTREPDNTHFAINECDLINFALSGVVTTKTPEQRRLFWGDDHRNNDPSLPAIHGLSEVARCIRREQGFWRIHSNDSAVDLDFTGADRQSLSEIITNKAHLCTQISGCMHYFMVPLWTEPPRAYRLDSASEKTSHFTFINLADYAFSARPGPSILLKPEKKWLSDVCEEITLASNYPTNPILLHLQALDDLEDAALETTCMELIHHFYALRDKVALFVSGVNAKTNFQIRRYLFKPALGIQFRVLPELTFSNESGITLDLLCSPEVEPIKYSVLEQLGSETPNPVELSNTPTAAWNTYNEVAAQNPTLFHTDEKSHRPEVVFKSNLTVRLSDQVHLRMLLGGMTFGELATYSEENQAVAQLVEGGYFRRGQILNTYIHVGRLWCSRNLQERIKLWLIMMTHLLRQTHSLDNSGNPIVIMAILHPAISLAHELIHTSAFANAELIEIHRVSDIRWDFEPLCELRGKNVIVIIDMTLTGSTVMGITKHLRYVGLTPLACFSVIALKTRQLDNEILDCTFCECGQNDIEVLAGRITPPKRTSKSKANYVRD